MKPKNKEIEKNKNIELNRYNRNTDLIINEYKHKKDKKKCSEYYLKRFNNTFNKLNNRENKININLKNKEKFNELIQTRSPNKLNPLNNSEYIYHFKSNSFFNKDKLKGLSTENNKTLIDNIRYNKYLIPMVQKKNIEKKIYRSKFLEAPNNIIDFLSQVRENSLKNRSDTEIKNKNKKNNINRKSNSYDKTSNDSSFINTNDDLIWKNSKLGKKISDYSLNNHENIYFRYLTENNNTTRNSDIIYKPKKIQFLKLENSYNNINYNGIETIREYKYNSSFINNEYDNYRENTKYNNYYKKKVLYPKINKDIGNIKDNYLENFNGQGISEGIKIDFEQYFHNKKLFLIYRAKLFKFLYRSLSKFINKYSIQLKYEFFQRIKKFEIKNKIYKQKILERLYPKRNNNTTKNHDINFKDIHYDRNNNNKISKKLNSYINFNSNNIKNRNDGNYNLNSSMNSSRSCKQIIKIKNMSESKRRNDSSELYRNINNLKEKYEEINIRKNFKDYKLYNLGLFGKKQMSNVFIKNKNIYNRKKNISNIFNGVYKRKKLGDFTDKDKPSYNTTNKSMKYFEFNSNKKNNTLENKYNYITESERKLYKKKFNKDKNDKELNKNNVNNKKINKTLIANRLSYINKKRNKNLLNNKNKQKDLYKSNDFLIKKIIKNIQTSDMRLFVNINYAYLYNTQKKEKKEKYNNNILNIVNSDNFSLYKNTKNNWMTNIEKLIGVIEEEESSNFNFTYEDKSSNNNSIIKRINIPNDKYLFSCVNFICKTIRRVILKNSYKYFKKRINLVK